MQTGSLSQNGNNAEPPAFEELVERFYRPLYQFGLSLSGSDADACDLVQHTFLTWRTKGDQLRDPTKVRTWLFTTLHRAFLESRRRAKKFRHEALEESDSELPWIAPEEGNHLDSTHVLNALCKLDELFRAPLALFYLEDCPYKEIAAALGVPLGTVKSRIARGIGQLQKLVAPSKQPRERLAA